MSKKVYSDKKTKPEKIEQSKTKEIIGLVIYCIIVVRFICFLSGKGFKSRALYKRIGISDGTLGENKRHIYGHT